MRMGRKRVPEREAPPRSMEVTSPEEEEQVIARHAHGDGACGSQSERKLKGSEETCKCLKCINRSASEFVASAAVMMNKAVTRNLTTLLADHDIFLLRYAFSLFIFSPFFTLMLHQKIIIIIIILFQNPTQNN